MKENKKEACNTHPNDYNTTYCNKCNLWYCDKCQDEHAKCNSNMMLGIIRKSSNPIIAIITILFKLLAIISFIILSLFTSNEAIEMLIVILLAAIDFWITKNISGRFLVGLRWHSRVDIKTGVETFICQNANEGIYILYNNNIQ